MIRTIFSFIFLHLALNSPGQDITLTDGPYLFYKGDYLFIESVTKGQWKKDSLVWQKQEAPLLSVAVPGRPGASFSFPLKTNLEFEPAEFKAAEKLFVVSDIEGTFQAFSKLLVTGGVIDNNFKWSFGNGHLVVCGDMFDRGDEVTACLWLLYKLEDEAKASGGYVHMVLGNHEIMNLSEDIRYVNKKYLAVATLMDRTYMDLYAINTELGRWLRTKNIIEKVGNWLFVHGGISQAVNENGLSLKKLNNRVRPFYDKDGFDSLLNEAKATEFFDGSTSPFWYRGYFLQPRASMDQVDSTLRIFNVKHIVVGHTIVDSIQTLYKGKVVAIDVNHHTANHQALVIENDSFYRMDADGKKTKLN
jgi:hypothetical protein